MARLDAGAVKATLHEKGEALRHTAQQSRPALARLWSRLRRPDPRALLAAGLVTLVASSLLLLAPGASCSRPTAVKVLHYNVTRVPLPSTSALVKPSQHFKSPLPAVAEETAFFQDNVATICEAVWSHDAGGRQLTGSLLVDCDTTAAKDTVDLCITAASPQLFLAFPPPQQAHATVLTSSTAPPWLLPHGSAASRVLLPLLTLLQLALPLLVATLLVGWLLQKLPQRGRLFKGIEREQGSAEERQQGEHGGRAQVGGRSPRSDIASDSQAPTPPRPPAHQQLPAEAGSSTRATPRRPEVQALQQPSSPSPERQF